MIHQITGLSIPVSGIEQNLRALDEVYAQFDARGAVYRANARNSHPCRAGCDGDWGRLTSAEAMLGQLHPEPAHVGEVA